MGLGDANPSDDTDGAAAAVACSICLDAVSSGGDRSTARLQCGHEFHLDCIGSAFNAKGLMQCPNCRKVEKGNWLYGNGSRALPDLSTHEWAHDEDLYDFTYSEMPFGVHWCPFGRLARVTPSFEEEESSPTISFQDLLGHRAIFAEHPTTSVANPCPYVAYFQPLQPPSTSNSHPLSESLIDGPAYHHHWSQAPGSTDIQTHPLPAIDLHYHSWEHHSAAYSIHGTHTSSSDQAPVSSATMRAAELDSDGLPRAGPLVHPFIPGHHSRTAGMFGSSLVPPYLSTSEAQVHAHEHYHHRNSPAFTGVWRPGGTRGWPMPISPPDHTGFYYLFPPTRSSSRSFQDAENTEGNRFYAWERDRFAPFPLLRVDRESGWWGPFPQSTASSDRMGFWHRHGSERSSSQGRQEGRPIHAARMRPFI